VISWLRRGNAGDGRKLCRNAGHQRHGRLQRPPGGPDHHGLLRWRRPANEHVLMWVDEFLYYYTTYGVRQVLNINPARCWPGTCCTS